jgi:alpha-L-fucosidase
VSIRPGWFYHQSQDNLVKSPAKLVDIYYSSVGRNSVLLLNIPPDRRGRIAKPDINSLVGMRKILDQTFSVNLARGSRVSATSEAPQHPSASILDDDVSTYWTTASGAETAVIIVDLRSAKTFDRALLAENIAVGQRIESFHLEAFQSEEWIEFARGTTVGYKRLLRFPAVSTRRVRIVIEGSRLSPTLSSFGLYKSPPVVRIEPAEGSFEKSLTVHLSTETPGASIYYTLDGTSPTETSTRYDGPIVLTRSATVTAVTTSDTSLSAETSVARFAQCIPLQSASLTIPPSIKYPGDGTRTIIDGKRGSLDFQDKRWLGFHGDNVDVVVDLGRERSLRELTIGFLQQQGSWIFLPKSVRMFVSSDSLQWKHVADLDNPLVRSERVFVKDFSFRSSVLRGRFIRFTASNIGTCPSWHAGSGDKAWLFVDEVLVR